LETWEQTDKKEILMPERGEKESAKRENKGGRTKRRSFSLVLGERGKHRKSPVAMGKGEGKLDE